MRCAFFVPQVTSMYALFRHLTWSLKEAIKGEKEWCATYLVTDSAAMFLLQHSLSKREAQREVQTWAAQYAADNEEEDGTDGKLTLVKRDADKVWEKGLYEIKDGEYLIHIIPASNKTLK
jgi:hypothetical protein